MTDTDEPERSPLSPTEPDDQSPPNAGEAQHPSSIEIELFDASGQLDHTQIHALAKLANRVLVQIPNRGSVRVRIVADDDMIAAHEKYCGLATTTDVLTFDLAHHETDHATKALDSDLIVCIDEARRQAQHRNHTHIHELLLYILHGVLHCLGHDDHTDNDYARMHAHEDQLLTAAGVGALFHGTQSKPQETTP